MKFKSERCQDYRNDELVSDRIKIFDAKNDMFYQGVGIALDTKDWPAFLGAVLAMDKKLNQ